MSHDNEARMRPLCFGHFESEAGRPSPGLDHIVRLARWEKDAGESFAAAE